MKTDVSLNAGLLLCYSLFFFTVIYLNLLQASSGFAKLWALSPKGSNNISVQVFQACTAVSEK